MFEKWLKEPPNPGTLLEETITADTVKHQLLPPAVKGDVTAAIDKNEHRFGAERKRSSSKKPLSRSSIIADMNLCSRALRNALRARQCINRPAWRLPDRRCARRTYASVSAADLQFGQPVHETHPHLVQAGEGMLTSRARICERIAKWYCFQSHRGSPLSSITSDARSLQKPSLQTP